MHDVEARFRRALAGSEVARDPELRTEISERPGGLLDVTITSSVFAGKDSFEREGLVWPFLRTLPEEDAVRMAYCLLLTPDEKAEYFAADAAQQTRSCDGGIEA